MYGRFASPDPARDQHFEQAQSWNIYSYVQNNPLSMTDPTGLAAWEIKNKWDDTYTKAYSEYYSTIAKTMGGEKLDCADMQLKVLTDFASANGLPVSIQTGSGKIDAASDQFKSVGDFTTAVQKATAASDLASDANTHRVSSEKPGSLRQLDAAKPGDMMFFKYSDDKNGPGRVHHVAGITDINNGFLRFAEGQQGIGNSDPKSLMYGGRGIQFGTLDTNNGHIGVDGKDLRVERFQFKRVDVREWNFFSWNSGGQ